MEILDKINAYVEKSTMVLIIGDSNLLLNMIFNSIYNKCPLKKYEYDKCKGLIRKLEKQKKKIIKINLDLNKIRLSSSNNPKKLLEDFISIQSIIYNNYSKILIKTNLKNYKEYVDTTNISNSIPICSTFDLIIYIKKTEIEILKRDIENFWFHEDKKYPIDQQLIRKAKLLKLEQRMKKEKESL